VRIAQQLGVLVALVAVGPTLVAQQSISLGKPDAETTESFTQVTAIRELPSGKLLVADSRDKVVQLVDLATGAMTKVGREGNGPGEYAIPVALVGLPNGTTLVHDLVNRRFLVVGPDGKPGAFLELPRPTATAGGGGPIVLGGMQQVRGYDDRGRLYFTGSPFSATGGSVDSVALLRWDRVKPSFDTVGYVKLPPNSVSRSGSGGNVMIRMGNNVRFTPAEAWAVAGDGSIARVFPSPYRVAWLNGRGAPVLGPIIPYTPLKVTEADKQAFLEQMRRNQGTRIMIGGPPGGGGGGGGGRPPGGEPPPPEFAETKPPFEAGIGMLGTVQATPEGEVWVLRTRPANDKTPSYDVFDKTGTLVKKVSLNPNSRVAGFGKGTVYVVRSDEDDLQYIQRYRRP
jgi:hypothetical protein